MKKVLLSLLSIAIAFTAMQPSQAQDQKVLAIIDSAINSKNFPSIIYEACLTNPSALGVSPTACPNGKTFMEGTGSASATWPTNMASATYHGDTMVKAALAVSPDIKILFVRSVDITKTGNPLTTSAGLVEAIKWVSQNADKYSVDAVSISQAYMTTTSLAECSVNSSTTNAVASLTAKNIPVFASTGNNGSLTSVGFPSCVGGVIGVGSMVSDTQFNPVTNRGAGLDLVTIGKITVTNYRGSELTTSATSSANVIAASRYVAKNTFSTFTEYLNALPKVVVSGISYTSSPRG